MVKKQKSIKFNIGGVLQLSKYDVVGKRGHHSLGIHEYLSKKFGKDLDSWFDSIDTDNRDWNLKPARKLRINTILFKDNKQVIKNLVKIEVLG